jgi:hypothetical protein
MSELKEIKPEYAEPKMETQQRASDVFGMFQTVSVAPTSTPINWFNQVQIYINGATHRLYVYDTSTNAWIYVALS